MNIRIVNTLEDKVLAEIIGAKLEEIPDAKTTIYIQGEEKYVCRVIKSYEPSAAGYITWFIVEV